MLHGRWDHVWILAHLFLHNLVCFEDIKIRIRVGSCRGYYLWQVSAAHQKANVVMVDWYKSDALSVPVALEYRYYSSNIADTSWPMI